MASTPKGILKGAAELLERGQDDTRVLRLPRDQTADLVTLEEWRHRRHSRQEDLCSLCVERFELGTEVTRIYRGHEIFPLLIFGSPWHC